MQLGLAHFQPTRLPVRSTQSSAVGQFPEWAFAVIGFTSGCPVICPESETVQVVSAFA